MWLKPPVGYEGCDHTVETRTQAALRPLLAVPLVAAESCCLRARGLAVLRGSGWLGPTEGRPSSSPPDSIMASLLGRRLNLHTQTNSGAVEGMAKTSTSVSKPHAHTAQIC